MGLLLLAYCNNPSCIHIHLFYFGKFVFTFSIRIAFIFIFVLKFLCLVCRLGVAGVGAGNLALKAPDCERGSDTMCSGHINLTSNN
jgi:hypothetical protein